MGMKKTRKVTIVKTTEIQIDQLELKRLIRKHLKITQSGVEIEIFHHVPGGGGWSRMNLDFNDSPLTVIVTEKEEAEKERLQEEKEEDDETHRRCLDETS